ncbi:MAG: aminodeoxychorismate/anthranilate synthase component II [Bacteroidetes bacterium]|nr:MAG: aminodeoxychorismate/anthranilate synthase component II [Bacteroidota bacterium]MBL1143707.1 aminodeoxychorismate/anthranilate synthase component II [Bacteroidota bacterium]NOG56509.1 aminodeoxychorismate/anthranilate synthase component II [Bacteroidota bacterium]
MSKILLIDNYDSFTFNLVHYLESLTDLKIVVVRNDEIDFSKMDQYDAVVISPGPGLPKQAGLLMDFLAAFANHKKILGICLGQQAIAEHFGMRLKNLGEVVHGQARKIEVLQVNRGEKEESGLFKGLPKNLTVGRYHSWVIEPESMSTDFEITSTDEQGNIMSIQHKKLPISSVQFHPESILTEFGKEMLKNWLDA